jgi:hypothetical protein
VVFAGLLLCFMGVAIIATPVSPTMQVIQSVGGEVFEPYATTLPDKIQSKLRAILFRNPHLKWLFLGPRDQNRLITRQVYNERLTDEAILQTDLSEIGPLMFVEMSGPRVTDRGFSHIAGNKLVHSVFCRKAQVTDAGLAVLANSLNTLDLSGNEITDAGVSSLARGTSLVGLELNDTRITDQGLKKLASSCTALSTLGISSTDVTDIGLACLSSMPKLSVVRVDTAQLTDEAVSNLFKFKLSGVGVGTCTAKKQSRLRQRGITVQTQIDDQVIARIAQLKSVSFIHLFEDSPSEPVELTSAAVKSLASMPALSVLYLTDIQIDSKVLSQIRSELPVLKISVY